MAAKSSAKSWPSRLALFQGHGKKTKARPCPCRIRQDRIVRVDEVIHAPPAMKDYAGKDITVLLTGRKKVAKGQQASSIQRLAVWRRDCRPVPGSPRRSARLLPRCACTPANR